jgi:hypothetical protein
MWIVAALRLQETTMNLEEGAEAQMVIDVQQAKSV